MALQRFTKEQDKSPPKRETDTGQVVSVLGARAGLGVDVRAQARVALGLADLAKNLDPELGAGVAAWERVREAGGRSIGWCVLYEPAGVGALDREGGGRQERQIRDGKLGLAVERALVAAKLVGDDQPSVGTGGLVAGAVWRGTHDGREPLAWLHYALIVVSGAAGAGAGADDLERASDQLILVAVKRPRDEVGAGGDGDRHRRTGGELFGELERVAAVLQRKGVGAGGRLAIGLDGDMPGDVGCLAAELGRERDVGRDVEGCCRWRAESRAEGDGPGHAPRRVIQVVLPQGQHPFGARGLAR